MDDSRDGNPDADLQHRLINRVCETLWLPAKLDETERMCRIQAAIWALAEIKPTDGLEGMLAVQMVATHNAALELLRRAMIPEQTFEGRNMALKHAEKLLGLYTRQLETLNKHRGRGSRR